MAVLPIRTLPDPILRRKTKRVTAVDKSVKKLVADIRETLHADAGRVGLAAPQVGVSLRLTVICLPEGEDIILINPEVVRRKGQRLVDEGCLSIPGYIGQLTRAESVTVKGQDLSGKPVRIKAEELLSQALEHEIDHLNGVLYIDRMENPEALRKVEPEEVGI
ncbi:MAG: peptide deformylase [Chloroflexi bacterium RBG_13_57_8]|nr:MAG: peptide deformylase [Chloroflexi bacterium RBG_13_57_8]